MRVLHARHPDVARRPAVFAPSGRVARTRSATSSPAHLCRCTGYVPIVKAALAAAATLRRCKPAPTAHARQGGTEPGCLIYAAEGKPTPALARLPSPRNDASGRTQLLAIDPMRWRSSTAIRLTYSCVVRSRVVAGRGTRRARPQAGRPRRQRAAEPLGGRDPALGLPVRRPGDDADQLARQAGRDRPLPGGLRRRALWSTRRSRPRRSPDRSRAAAEPPGWRSTPGGRRPAPRRRCSTRPRRTRKPRVGPEAWSLMLYTSGTTSRPEGRAAPPSGRAGGGGGPRRAEPLSPRRAHARA